MQVAQGDLAGALKSYRDSLAIIDAAGAIRSRQRRLAARSVGVVRQDRRRAAGAGRPCGCAEVLPRQPRHHCRGWRNPIPATPTGSAICRCRTRRSATCRRRRATLRRAQVLPRRPRHPSGWRNPIPATPAGSAISRVVRQGRRRADGAGRPCGALESYRDSLAISERLAQSDPGNAVWQRDLRCPTSEVGDVQVAQGDLQAR